MLNGHLHMVFKNYSCPSSRVYLEDAPVVEGEIGQRLLAAMDGIKRKGYAWAIAAGLNAAAAAIAAKFFSYPLVRYGLVVLFNVTMWGCYVNSLKALSSLQATVTNFATNFLSSGLAGFFLFQEMLSVQWFAGALLIVIGVVILSKSSRERKMSID